MSQTDDLASGEADYGTHTCLDDFEGGLDPEIERKLAAIKPVVDRSARDRYWVKDRETGRPVFRDQPFTQARLIAHLEGKACYGLAQMERGSSTTRVALVDLDNHDNTLPAGVLAKTARDIADTLELLGYYPTIWTSGGGVGAHIILIWDTPQDAYSVRTFLKEVIETCRPEQPMLIEIFPKQNRLTSQGKGSNGSMAWIGFNRASTPWTTSSVSWVAWRPSPDVLYVEAPVRQTNAELHRSADLERLREASLAVAAADPDRYGSRDEWRNFVFALHKATEGSEEGFELADEFSSLVPKYEDSDDVRKLWDSASLDKDNAVGTDLILKRAEQAGWQDPQAFADVADLVEEIPNSELAKPNSVRRRPWQTVKEWTLEDLNIFLGPMGDALKDPPMAWLIHHVLPKAPLAMIYGPSNSGKSLLAFDLAIAIVSGQPWRGQHVTKGRVLYFAAEGSYGLGDRVAALKVAGIADIEAMGDAFVRFSEAPNLLDPAQLNGMAAMLAADAKLRGAPAAVFIDTMSCVFNASDSDEESAKKLVKAFMVLHEASGGALIVAVHHTGKDVSKGARGSSLFEGYMDQILEVKPSADGAFSEVEVHKARYGPKGGRYNSKLEKQVIGAYENGDDRTGAYVVPATLDERPAGSKRRPGPNQQAVLDALEALGGESTEAELLEEFMRKEPPTPDAKGQDLRPQKFRGALKTLLDRAKIPARIIEHKGRYKRMPVG